MTTKDKDNAKSKSSTTKAAVKSPKTLFKKGKEVAGEILTGAAKGAAAGALEVVAEAVGVNDEDSKSGKGAKTPAKKETSSAKAKGSASATKSKDKPKSTKAKK